MVKVTVGTASCAGHETTKWINRKLKSMGEPPVIVDSHRTARSAADLKAELNNEGYLGASVEVATKKKRKKIDVTYILHTGQPYYIKGIRYVVEDPVVSQLLCLEDSVNQGLKPGLQFRVESLDNDRKRITDMPVDNGS